MVPVSESRCAADVRLPTLTLPETENSSGPPRRLVSMGAGVGVNEGSGAGVSSGEGSGGGGSEVAAAIELNGKRERGTQRSRRSRGKMQPGKRPGRHRAQG